MSAEVDAIEQWANREIAKRDAEIDRLRKREGTNQMKATIEVENKQERDAIIAGLGDPVVRAFCICVGVLNALPTHKARTRVMQYIADRFEAEESGGGAA